MAPRSATPRGNGGCIGIGCGARDRKRSRGAFPSRVAALWPIRLLLGEGFSCDDRSSACEQTVEYVTANDSKSDSAREQGNSSMSSGRTKASRLSPKRVCHEAQQTRDLPSCKTLVSESSSSPATTNDIAADTVVDLLPVVPMSGRPAVPGTRSLSPKRRRATTGTVEPLVSDLHGDGLTALKEKQDIEKALADRNKAFKMVKTDGLKLRLLPTFQGDQDIAHAAVTQNALALEFVNLGSMNSSTPKSSHRSSLKSSPASSRASSPKSCLKYSPWDREPDICERAWECTDVKRQIGFVANSFVTSSRGFQIVFAAVAKNGLALQFAGEKYQRDGRVVVKAVQQNGLALRYASAALRRDANIVEEAVMQEGLALQYAAAELRDVDAIVKMAVVQNGLALQYAGDSCRAGLTVVMKAIEEDPLALQFAHPSLRGKQDVVEAAVFRDPQTLQYSLLKQGYEEAEYEAIKKDPTTIRFCHPDVQHALLGSDCGAELLEAAGKDVQNSFSHVVAAVKHDPKALQYASKEIMLRVINELGAHVVEHAGPYATDPDVVYATIAKDPNAARLLPPEVLNDTQLALRAVGKRGTALRFFPDEFLKDHAVVLAAIAQDSKAYHLLRRDDVATAWDDAEVVLAAVCSDGLLLEHVPRTFTDSAAFVLPAVRQNALALRFASESMRSNRVVVDAAFERDPTSLQYAHRDEVLRIVAEDGLQLKYASPTLREDPDICAAAVCNDKYAIDYVGAKIKAVLPSLIKQGRVRTSKVDNQ